MWMLFELFYKVSYMGKGILLTHLDLSVARQKKENFKMDIRISIVFTTAFTSNILRVIF